MTSLARRPSSPMLSSERRAFAALGGSAESQRTAAAALATMAPSGWLTSWAIEAVSSPIVITRDTRASSVRAASSASSLARTVSSRQLALADVARQRKVQQLVSLLERPGADFDGEQGAVVPSMERLERDRFTRARPLREQLHRPIVQTGIEQARVNADQFLAAVAQALAGLAVDVQDGELAIEQEEGIRRAVHEGAEPGLAAAQGLLDALAFGNVLHDAEVADGVAGLVAHHVALTVHDPHGPVETEHAVFEVISRTAPQGRLHGARHPGPILGVDEAQPATVPLRHVVGLDAVNAAAFMRQRDTPREEFAFPPPDTCDVLRCFQPALAFRQPAEREDTVRASARRPPISRTGAVRPRSRCVPASSGAGRAGTVGAPFG